MIYTSSKYQFELNIPDELDDSVAIEEEEYRVNILQKPSKGTPGSLLFSIHIYVPTNFKGIQNMQRAEGTFLTIRDALLAYTYVFYTPTSKEFPDNQNENYQKAFNLLIEKSSKELQLRPGIFSTTS